MSCLTTAGLNIIAWNKACAIFARETFLDNKSFMLKEAESDNPSYNEVLHSLYKRGWSLDDVTRDEVSQNTGTRHLRRLGDSYTWQIQLPEQDVVRSQCPDSVLECSSFRIDIPR